MSNVRRLVPVPTTNCRIVCVTGSHVSYSTGGLTQRHVIAEWAEELGCSLKIRRTEQPDQHRVLARRQTIKLNCDSSLFRSGEDRARRVFLGLLISCGASH